MEEKTNTIDSQAETMIKCYHCGDDCPDNTIFLEEKYFCCEGCKMVFGILQENDMCQFYDIDENAAYSLKGKRKAEYGWLDDPEIVKQLIDFTDGETTKASFYLPQIHCSSCIWLLENLFKFNKGISTSKVNFLKKTIYINYNPEVTNYRKVVELLDSIGYTPELNLDSIYNNKQDKKTDKSFFYKLGLTGFAFGNIMLMSFPEYLGIDKSTDNIMFNVFGYFNILLSLPVVFYGASDYIKSAWISIKQYKLNIDVPITIGIFSIFLRSIFEIVFNSGAGYLDSLAGLVFFLLIGKWFQRKTYDRLSFDRDYRSYFPISIIKKEGDTLRPIAISSLEAGHNIIVKNEELIPADGILTNGNAYIDYSFVTGESNPINVAIGEKIFAGGRQMGTTIDINVTKKVSQSYLTQLWNDNSFKDNDDSTISRIADTVGERFTLIVLLIAFSTLAYWLVYDPSLALNAFSSVLIIACPCAVSLSIPFTFGNVMRILTKHQFFLKNTEVVENISDLDTIVFDKTGTLTNNSESKIEFIGSPLSSEEKLMIKNLTSQSFHPLSRTVAKSISEKGNLAIDNFDEIVGSGISGIINGNRIKIGSANYVETDNLSSKNQVVWIKINEEIRGHFSISNVYRTSLSSTLQSFNEKYDCYLLSGDLDKNKDEWFEYFDKDKIKFEQNPMDKLNFIKSIQEKGHRVMMIGDGLNDAGALQQSDIGVVITENINNFNPACDAILQGVDFSSLPQYIEYNKQSIKLVYYAYALAFVYNIIGLSFAVQGVLSPLIAAILMPLSSVSVVLFGVISSNLLAKKMKIS